MGVLKDKIKNDIIGPYDKGNSVQEKTAEVIDIDKGKNTCTISVVGRDGFPILAYNVRVKRNAEGLIQWSPEPGDIVQVTEVNRRYTIVGKHTNHSSSDPNNVKNDNFSSGLNELFGGWLGL